MQKPALAAFCVMAGIVFGEASNEVVPQHHLIRPLVVAAVLGLVVGLVALFARQYAVVTAASAAVLLVSPSAVTLLIVACAALVVVVSRILERPVDIAAPTLAAVAVFALAGAVQFLPQVSFGERAHAAVDGPPVYLILLDGYPRIDVLDELGLDNQPFVTEMEARGFEHHADARSLHRTTYRTLTAMLVGRVDPDTWGTIEERRAARQEWRLPSGFVAVSSPYGHTTLPHTSNIGPGGISTFEVHLLESLVGPVAGDFILDGLRSHVRASLHAVVETDHHRVFAHVAAPHPPYLFDSDGAPRSAPECWPEDCDLWDDRPSSDQGLHGTVEWLNGLLLEMVEGILEKHPDAVIALFGDHGARLTDGPDGHDYLPLLLTRGVNLDEPRPDRILDALG